MSKTESETALETDAAVIPATIPVVVHKRGDMVLPTIRLNGISTNDGREFELDDLICDSFGELEIKTSFGDPAEFPATAIVEIHIKEITPGWDRAR